MKKKEISYTYRGSLVGIGFTTSLWLLQTYRQNSGPLKYVGLLLINLFWILLFNWLLRREQKERWRHEDEASMK